MTCDISESNMIHEPMFSINLYLNLSESTPFSKQDLLGLSIVGLNLHGQQS